MQAPDVRTLPHLSSPYKGEGKNSIGHAQANHSVNELLNTYKNLNESTGSRYNLNRLSRNALAMTDTELNVMATLAMMGLRRSPRKG